MGRKRQVRAVDGHTIGAYEALPSDEPRGSVVVIQEIFGVNQHIRDVVDGFASDGYAAIAPQVFDRAKRDVELGYGPDDMTEGLRLAFNDTSRDNALIDLQAATEEIGKYGKVGIVGFCYGGLLSWLSACSVRGLSAAVVYYGGGIAGELEKPSMCPVMMHFGELDSMIPPDQVEAINKALPNAEIYTYEADHGFNCDHRDSYNAEASALAQQRTLAFLENFVAS
ncbi:MAG: dienelactone hydrolase family protein [Gammaproteobacteria bacterium]|nr:dienelactone hydrolase family protein [Gammaproteobacteria bacterium]MYD79432.1 dienelactone hydrolase family protein [Gammaproteobacteria bacterium]